VSNSALANLQLVQRFEFGVARVDPERLLDEFNERPVAQAAAEREDVALKPHQPRGGITVPHLHLGQQAGFTDTGLTPDDDHGWCQRVGIRSSQFGLERRPIRNSALSRSERCDRVVALKHATRPKDD
jgi:hypothetical protein